MREESLATWDGANITWGGRVGALGTVPVCVCTEKAGVRDGFLAGKGVKVLFGLVIGLVHTVRTRRPHPKGNLRNARVSSASKSSEVKKNVTVEDHHRMLLVSKNQKTMSYESMASEQSSSGPVLQEMIPGTISSGLVQKPSSSTSYVPPSRNDWDLLFQPLFDELLNPPSSVDNQATKVIAPIAEVIPQVDGDSTGLPSSTTVD
nr:hypothetical protein [Tanacetum cinerariifolium]